MSYGLVNLQRNLDQQSKAGLQEAARLESQREATNNAIEEQEKANRMNSMAMGAGMGFAVGGPVGAGVGAAAGYLMYEFL